ncbi:protein kinase domain-containing protein [Nocardia sp. CA-290969]|uniref:serine/threonine-protein kinase n=1 Tax=Nocardia sp. CA-290969 TaxID=3239986 RepID=UPI003D8B29B0
MWYPLLVEGTPFGRYRLLELLGAGAMGEVHRAYDTGTDRLVAVKVLAPEFAHNATYRKRFQREAQAAARLSEPHIVPIHDFGEIDGRLFLDMRLVQGPNLATLLAERDHLEPEEAVEVVAQIAAALDAAHAEGLVHRDVKPSNILVTPAGFAYLIDFGIARSDEDTTVTTTGAVIGTFAYMAPERLADDDSGAPSDVYSLACVLYECLVGAKPYRGESMQRQIAAHLNEEPPAPSTAGLPRQFDAVIAKGMAKDPGQRYETAGALAVAARAALREPATALSPAPADPARPSDPPTPATAAPALALDPATAAPASSPDPATAASAFSPYPGTPATATPASSPDPAIAAAPGPGRATSTTPEADPAAAAPVATPATAARSADPSAAVFVPPKPGPRAGAAPPAPRFPRRAAVVLSVLALAIAGTSAIALTRDNSTLVTETPGSAPSTTRSTVTEPAVPARPSSPPRSPAPPVSVTESVPVTSMVPDNPAGDPGPPPVRTEPEPQPSSPPPPPPVTTTTPPPVTTTTVEPTPSETTTPETTTPETTTSETTVTTTTGENNEGEEAAGGADATGSAIATSSTAGGTGTSAAPASSAGTTTRPSATGTTPTPTPSAEG